MSKVGYRLKNISNRASSIYVNFRPPGSKVLEIRTGLSIPGKSWSSSKQRGKGSMPEVIRLNQSLDGLSNHILGSFNDAIVNKIPITLKWFRSIVGIYFGDFNTDSRDTLQTFYASYLERLLSTPKESTSMSPNTIKSYKNFLVILDDYKKYCGNESLLKSFDKNEFDLFYDWLIRVKQYKATYAKRIISRLKFVLREASLVGLEVNPVFNSYTVKTTGNQKFLTILNDNDYNKIKNYIPESTSIANARKWTLFGLLIGQRVSDLLSITVDLIRFESDRIALIDVTQKKTGIKVTCGIKDPEVIDILKNDFPYPVSSQTFNRQLKSLCKLSGIDEMTEGYIMTEIGRKKLCAGPKYKFITSHDLRRSFATNSFYKNIPVPIIMGITGHKKESTFYEYINYTPSSDDKAMAYLSYI